jgi:tagaturonate reductase
MSLAVLNKAMVNKELSLITPVTEKVIQFGTGVLLRGLPDFFIHHANEKGIFNGSIVVVKSTTQGGIAEFSSQDNLFTHCIRGVYHGVLVNDSFVNSAISRVVEAKKDWNQLIELAQNENIEVIISNTTEAGLIFDGNDLLGPDAPNSFPAKLLALLYARWKHFEGALNKGWVILPTELVPDNANVLLNILLKLAKQHSLPEAFVKWIIEANEFCNTLVDRIVPGKLNENEMHELENTLGYKDQLLISSEPFALWAIEAKKSSTITKISFATIDERVVVAPSIVKYRELKLRLLNGTHTFSCAVAIMAGFTTVIQAMQNKAFNHFITGLALEEIVPCVVDDTITEKEAIEFARSVIERFSNPFIEHNWTSIAMNYEEKMKMRNRFLMEKYILLKNVPAEKMTLGFAAFVLYMEKEHQRQIDALNFCNHQKFIDQVEKWKEKINEIGIKTILGI